MTEDKSGTVQEITMVKAALIGSRIRSGEYDEANGLTGYALDYYCFRHHRGGDRCVDARTPKDDNALGNSRCFDDTYLRESIATLKQQGGADVARVSESLLTKARTADGCRIQLVQALINGMAQATNPKAKQYENFFLWVHGASLLGELRATEALDLLIANIDFTDGWSTKISEHYTPALVAILRIGQPAIPKLQIALNNDPVPHRRQFAAFAIAYIGGSKARRALKSALPAESDPCLKKFLQVSLEAFKNREKPNHVSSALNGKWLGAFYCVQTN